MNPKIKINYTIPLGFCCPTALTLRRLDVMRCSYPFKSLFDFEIIDDLQDGEGEI